MPPTRKHLNIDISDKFDAAIAEMCQKHGCSRTQAVTRLAGVGKFILDAQDEGEQIVVGKQAMRFLF